ncbi:MAG: signal recognition particle receptor subunit alpha, partial [Clostridia bacterium]|nr:signal recognition particle receptor subunit alpha [Clostridia bacterium]
MKFLEKLKAGLKKTKNAIIGQIDNLFKAFVRIDEDLFEELEELLISADVGVQTTEEIMEELRASVKESRETNPEAVKKQLFGILRNMIGEGEELTLKGSPAVILVIGVNG